MTLVYKGLTLAFINCNDARWYLTIISGVRQQSHLSSEILFRLKNFIQFIYFDGISFELVTINKIQVLS